MARPSKLTPAVQERLLEAIKAGSYYEEAAAYAGITYQTFRNWMIAGEKAKSGLQFEFFEAVTRAEAEAVVAAQKLWRSAFDADWRAIQAWMERRYPDRWGRKDRVSIESMKRAEAEKIAREQGLDLEEVLVAIDAILAGRD